MPLRLIREFLQLEAASGLLLMLSAFLALVSANSSLSPYYDALLNTIMAWRLGDFLLQNPCCCGSTMV